MDLYIEEDQEFEISHSHTSREIQILGQRLWIISYHMTSRP